MLQTIVTHAVTAAVGLCLGWWGHYRYGSSLKNFITTIETRVQQDAKKL